MPACAEDQADVAVHQTATPGSGKCIPCRLGTRTPYKVPNGIHNFDRFAAYVPQQSAYGVMLIGLLTADRNLHILAAVCSTSSKPVLGACKLEFVSSGAGVIGLWTMS